MWSIQSIALLCENRPRSPSIAQRNKRVFCVCVGFDLYYSWHTMGLQHFFQIKFIEISFIYSSISALPIDFKGIGWFLFVKDLLWKKLESIATKLRRLL